ncbi:MAG: SURF1 family cytochrome oxidase biogenesis protein [Mycobacteriaceae bacterium]
MRRLSFLLRPGWLILAIIVLSFAYLCFTVLAPWQLHKNTATSQRNSLISKSVDAPAIPLGEVLKRGELNSDNEWQKVIISGTYIREKQVLVRLRAAQDSPSTEVIVPFRTDDGLTVLINRGYVRHPSGSQIPIIAPAPTDHVTVQARIRMPEAVVTNKDIFMENGVTQVYSINSGQISAITGVDTTNSYLQLSENQPGGLEAIPLPQLESGPFLSYGLQWIAFGIMAPLGFAYFLRAELTERKQRKISHSSKPTDQSETTTVSPLVTRAEKLADRYGSKR